MPVGEGSIKRAAGKAAIDRKKTEEDRDVDIPQEAGEPEDKASGVKRKTAGRPKAASGKAGRSPAGKSLAEENPAGKSPAGESLAGKSQAGKKAASGKKNASQKGQRVNMTESAESESIHEAYGIGQPLPTYLL